MLKTKPGTLAYPDGDKIDSFVGNFTSPALTYWRPCPTCGSIEAKTVLELNDFQFYTDSAQLPKRVTVRECMCRKCFTLYLNPCYSDFGFKVLFAEAGRSYGSTEGRPREQIDWLDHHGLLQTNMLVMDAGCYQGDFLAALPRTVLKVGVDIDEPAILRGRSLYADHRIEFVLGDFESFQYMGRAPDVITMFHVLEHLPRPVEVLMNLRTIAHPKTHLVVEVPVLENGQTNDINGFFSVQHMTHFSRTSLQNCFGKAGWRVIELHEQADYNGYRVLAIPDEPKPSVIGNENDVGLLHDYLSAWHQSVLKVERIIRSLPEHHSVEIWGGGAHTEFLYQFTTLFNPGPQRRFKIVDSDPLKQGKTWRGIHIDDPGTLQYIDWSTALLVISSYGSQEDIAKAAVTFGVPTDRIAKLYTKIRRY